MLHNNHRFLIIVLGILFFSNVAFAQNTVEISQLKIKIFELEKRLDQIERIIGKSPSTQLQYSEKWKNRALWRKLRKRMPAKQVESLLGMPRRISAVPRQGIYWYYINSTSYAYVRFDGDSKIYGWEEPK